MWYEILQADLINMTWHEVQRKLLEAQKELQMCIHKAELTELGLNEHTNFWFLFLAHYSQIFTSKNYRIFVCASSGTENINISAMLMYSVVYCYCRMFL